MQTDRSRDGGPSRAGKTAHWGRLWVAAALGAVACAGQLPAPTQADADRAQVQYPGTTLEELQSGRRLYVDHCSGCHPLRLPNERPAGEWAGHVDEMAEDAKLAPGERALVVRYLVVAAERPEPVPSGAMAAPAR